MHLQVGWAGAHVLAIGHRGGHERHERQGRRLRLAPGQAAEATRERSPERVLPLEPLVAQVNLLLRGDLALCDCVLAALAALAARRDRRRARRRARTAVAKSDGRGALGKQVAAGGEARRARWRMAEPGGALGVDDGLERLGGLLDELGTAEEAWCR